MEDLEFTPGTGAIRTSGLTDKPATKTASTKPTKPKKQMAKNKSNKSGDSAKKEESENAVNQVDTVTSANPVEQSTESKLSTSPSLFETEPIEAIESTVPEQSTSLTKAAQATASVQADSSAESESFDKAVKPIVANESDESGPSESPNESEKSDSLSNIKQADNVGEQSSASNPDKTDASASPIQPVKTRISKKQRRLELQEYKEAFLTPYQFKTKRHNTHVDDWVWVAFDLISRRVGDRRANATSTINKVLIDHLRTMAPDVEGLEIL